jgi:hypothetical protein
MLNSSRNSRPSDAGLIALAEQCAAARLEREKAFELLETARGGRSMSTLEPDAALRALDANYRIITDEFYALAFVLAWARASTLSGVLAKARALPNDGDAAGLRNVSADRLNSGNSVIARHIARALKWLGSGGERPEWPSSAGDLPCSTGRSKYRTDGAVGEALPKAEMKEVLLAEWTGVLGRIKAGFSRADLDGVDQQIRAVLIELARRAAPTLA